MESLLLGGEGQPVCGFGTCIQRGIPRVDLEYARGERLSRRRVDADSLCLCVAKLRKRTDSFVTYSRNLKIRLHRGNTSQTDQPEEGRAQSSTPPYRSA